MKLQEAQGIIENNLPNRDTVAEYELRWRSNSEGSSRIILLVTIFTIKDGGMYPIDTPIEPIVKAGFRFVKAAKQKFHFYQIVIDKIA